jgi:hypothetical protein
MRAYVVEIPLCASTSRAGRRLAEKPRGASKWFQASFGRTRAIVVGPSWGSHHRRATNPGPILRRQRPIAEEAIETSPVRRHAAPTRAVGPRPRETSSKKLFGRHAPAKRRSSRSTPRSRTRWYERPERSDYRGAPWSPARAAARTRTASVIGAVSLPVNVFCWLG